MKTAEFLVIILIVVIIVYYAGTGSCYSNFTFGNNDYQYSDPSPIVQNDYYSCIKNRCIGNTHDYDCLQSCRLDAFRQRMGTNPDIQTRVCGEDPTYECLVNRYAANVYP